MQPWVAILIGAGVTLFIGIAAWLTFGLKLLERREGTARWRGEVDTDRKSFKQFMKEIRKEIGALREDLRTYFREGRRPLIQSGSPLELTEFGKELSAELDGQKWATGAADRLADQLRNVDAYEIQQFCFDHVETVSYSEDQRKTIREIAYRHGLTEGNVRRVLAIELRDRLLELTDQEPPEQVTRL